MGLRRLFFTFLIAFLILPQIGWAAYSLPSIVLKEVDATRIVPLTVKVVFIGPYFSPEIIDESMLRRILPKEKVNLILMDENTTGVVYRIDYEFTFTSESFRHKLIKFLKAVEDEEKLKNPWFYVFKPDEEWFVSEPIEVTAYTYDAKIVEKWLIDNSEEFGGFPVNGYVLVLADLRELPSVTYEEVREFLEARTFGARPPEVKAHYYKINYMDVDRGYRLMYREFAVGWGGSNRLWFLDLSAGPTFVSMWYDLPIQVVMEDQDVDPYTRLGSLWITEFLADHIWEFLYNLAAPNFVYDPPLSRRFRVEIAVVDCRTEEEKLAVPIETTVNLTLIEEAVSWLLPASEVEVEVVFLNVTEFPALERLIGESSGTLDSWMHRYLFLSPMNISYVDAQPVYSYLRGRLEAFIPDVVRSREEYVIPVIAFAFSNDTHFSFKYKWLVMRINIETGAIWGVAFEELILIGMSQKDFLYGNHVKPKQKNKGLGFTQVIIHEVGHMLGLAHPHQYGSLGSFVSSALSYFAYEYKFSVFDRDALARIHVDKTLIEVVKRIIETRNILTLRFNGDEVEAMLEKAEDLMEKSNSEYFEMNYTGALRLALEALRIAEEALKTAKKLPRIPRDLMAELKAKRMEVKRLNSSYLELKTAYEALKLSHVETQEEVQRLREELNQAVFSRNLLLTTTVISLIAAVILIVRRKS